MKQRNLKALISKIILFYSVFYGAMKIIAVLFNDAWPLPNLIMAIPFVIFAVVGGLMLKRDSYSWIYVAAGVIVISIVRYYEIQWLQQLHQYFS
ncbi:MULTISPECIES: hypothetical protein [Salegentibacter]|uniref:Uncharacterized protein n=1 Tax=Salegentibacter maritimus TaxID=2794347 RepID=A0ABS0TFQ0_9FLAO|nr:MULTISPECIES: hypothetical protein [Salegentibacter]MBE7640307.1 hypothetical protein [Salegentibacter sp. BLCTC]MBI6118096.1 hypothetical protein [Salegentibacter maritimus]MBI6119880.1 hypothetical protein [Salegentibacter maritimus]